MSSSPIAPAIRETTPQSGPATRGTAAGTLPARWAFLRSPAADGVTNMAIDAALLELAGADDRAVWRCYAWDAPTVSFGRNERTSGRFSAAGLRTAGLRAVRRPTGGRALLHTREVTYSVAFPLDERLAWRVAYAAVNHVLLRALQSLGVSAQLVSDREAPAIAPEGPVCFEHPAAGEIMVSGRKLVGSAVWRHGGAYLQHGSILLADDQGLLAHAADVPLPAPPPAASLAACVPSQAHWTNVVDALAATLETDTGPDPARTVEPFVASPDFARRTAAHHAAIANEHWLWRR